MRAEHVMGAPPSGGVYFALQVRVLVVRKLEQLLEALRQREPVATFSPVPVVDLRKQREVVAEAAAAHVAGLAETSSTRWTRACGGEQEDR
jgi:hypothetical protein